MKKNKIVTLLALAAFTTATTSTLSAHAYIGPGSELKSRVEWHGTENGYPDGSKDEIGEITEKDALMRGLIDGRVADSRSPENSKINKPSTDWKKNEVESGSSYDVNFNVEGGANHKTKHVKFYMTKDNWNPDDGLQKEDFEEEPIHYEKFLEDGENFWDYSLEEIGVTSRTMNVEIPEEKEGYHVLAYEWDIADNGSSWYSVLDLNVNDDLKPGEEDPNHPGEEEEPTDPPAECPSGLHDMSTDNANTTLYTMWNMNTECEDYSSSYDVYLDGAKVGTTTENFYFIENLTPDTEYDVKIIDTKTNVSMEDTFKTERSPVFSGVEDETIQVGTDFDIMEGVKAIDKDGKEIDKIKTRGRVNTRRPGEYVITYTAKDSYGYITTVERTITVQKDAPVEGKEWDPTPGVEYKKGEIVSHEGKKYEVIQDFVANGDPGWILAPSLFTEVK